MTHIAGKPSINEIEVDGKKAVSIKGTANIAAKNKQNNVVAMTASGAAMNPYS